MSFTSKTLAPVRKKMELAGMNLQDIERECSFALQIINGDKRLISTTPESKMSAIVNVANIGLTLNPAAKEAYLISRWNSALKATECVLMPSYIGLKNLLIASGAITSINAQLVRENDDFEHTASDNHNPIVHKITSFSTEARGRIVGCYALATLSDGTKQAEGMSLDELYKIRECSDGWQAFQSKKIKSCPWHTHEGEMMRKTVVRRLYKYLPHKGKQEHIQNAIELDNQEYQASFNQVMMIESLLRTANLSEKVISQIESEITSLTFHRAQDCIKYLKENQVETSVQNGNAQSVKELGKSLADAVADEKR